MNPVETGISLGDIVRRYGSEYIRKERPSPRQCKVIRSISLCRSEALGSQLFRCRSCGYEHLVHFSCRDRHCPVCQFKDKEKWLMARKNELLPVPYFHLVFTLPDSLNELVYRHKKMMYNLLFKAASGTILKLTADKRHVGGQGGLLAVLHTWGQNLSFHPHLHCIVPGGALSLDGNHWIYPRKSTRRKKFFVHVNIISQLFRNLFLLELKKVTLNNPLYSARLQPIAELINELYKTKWVTYCKPPFGGPEQVLEYLSRYTHRVAISNNRIIALDNDLVSFSYRDYRDNNKTKVMTLPVFEFIRRFLLHVLPKGFFKIRYFGILSSRKRRYQLQRAQKLMIHFGNKTKLQTCRKIAFDPHICPRCRRPTMTRVEKYYSTGTLALKARSP